MVCSKILQRYDFISLIGRLGDISLSSLLTIKGMSSECWRKDGMLIIALDSTLIRRVSLCELSKSSLSGRELVNTMRVLCLSALLTRKAMPWRIFLPNCEISPKYSTPLVALLSSSLGISIICSARVGCTQGVSFLWKKRAMISKGEPVSPISSTALLCVCACLTWNQLILPSSKKVLTLIRQISIAT